MKNTFRCPTVASPPATRPLFALGAAVILLTAPALVLTGCGGGGNGDPSPSPSTGTNQTTITGRLLDVNNGSSGVSGATIQFAGATVQTDSSGNFSLTISRNTASGSAAITPPSGKTYYSYASNTAGCANTLSFSVAGPLAGATFSVGNVFVYSKTASTAPNPPCI